MDVKKWFIIMTILSPWLLTAHSGLPAKVPSAENIDTITSEIYTRTPLTTECWTEVVWGTRVCDAICDLTPVTWECPYATCQRSFVNTYCVLEIEVCQKWFFSGCDPACATLIGHNEICFPPL